MPKAVLMFPELLGDVEVQAMNLLLSMYTAFGVIFGWISHHFRGFLSPSDILSRGLIVQFGIVQRPLRLEFTWFSHQPPYCLENTGFGIQFLLLKTRELGSGFQILSEIHWVFNIFS